MENYAETFIRFLRTSEFVGITVQRTCIQGISVAPEFLTSIEIVKSVGQLKYFQVTDLPWAPYFLAFLPKVNFHT